MAQKKRRNPANGLQPVVEAIFANALAAFFVHFLQKCVGGFLRDSRWRTDVMATVGTASGKCAPGHDEKPVLRLLGQRDIGRPLLGRNIGNHGSGSVRQWQRSGHGIVKRQRIRAIAIDLSSRMLAFDSKPP